MASPGPVCRSPVVGEKLCSRTAFEDLNLIGEQDEDIVMVDSEDEPLKKSAKVADSDADEPISNLKERKGKGKEISEVQITSLH